MSLIVRICIATIFMLSLVSIAGGQRSSTSRPLLIPYHSNGIYAVGDTVGWKVNLPAGSRSESSYDYTVKENNWKVIKAGQIDLTRDDANIEVTLHEPAMVLLQITDAASPANAVVAGAAVAPEKLMPSTRRPADFDRFWETKIKLLQSIPEQAVVTPEASGWPDIDYAKIRLNNINGTHVYGQLAKPKRDGKFPALIIFQWASPPYPLRKSWVTDRAADGWLTLNIEPHDVLPDESPEYYRSLPEALKNYQTMGREDREKNYFLQMYLADYRAVEYLASRPDWDGKTLIVMGTSMGGQQSLCVAGLNPKVTGVIVDEPAGCDANGPLHGRASGYPNWPADDPKAMETARYFDVVNFASRIKVPALVAMGFVDTTAPPAGIWTAFNQIKGPKEAAPMVDSPHNHLATPAQQFPFTNRSRYWLNNLIQGKDVKPYQDKNGPPATSLFSAEGTEPVERSDQPSQDAHARLLEKAKAGNVDIYFLGDSITRRWAAVNEEPYKPLLANWQQNFMGWRVGDFGWGGDTVQNILWRIDQGELDNVNPKVIVLLAGTNNIGKDPPTGTDDHRIASIVNGMKAVLHTCREKAPNATIVLMAITPRNDNPAVMPLIDRVNAHLAEMADGTTIRFIDLNDKLADRHGILYEGMVNRDGLHLDVKAYQIWADALKPIFTELVGPPVR